MNVSPSSRSDPVAAAAARDARPSEDVSDPVESLARLRELMRRTNTLVENLDHSTVLRRIVEIGVDLTRARYGALGVLAEGGRLEQFIHVGMSPGVVASIGELPEGKGLLGALTGETGPVRLDHIAADARSSGFPANHPPMASFLGVPIFTNDRVFGNLYLTDSVEGAFSAEDAELARSLAATAGIAIQNARLFEAGEYRQRWSTALLELSRDRMVTDDIDEVGILLDRLKEQAGAELVSVALRDAAGTSLVVLRALGLGAQRLTSMSFPLSETLADEPMRTGRPVIVRRLGDHPSHGFDEQSLLGNAMLIPFGVGGRSTGLVSVARSSEAAPFAPRDLEMAESYAGHVGSALDRAEARGARQRATLLEDRSRIARDLHDHVIQRLFATGLSLQGTASTVGGPLADALVAQVKEIDHAITQIRQSIFALQHDETDGSSLRARVLAIVDRAGRLLTNRPQVSFSGPVDLVVDRGLADDVAAVVSEAVTNAVRHAAAEHITVLVTTADGTLTVEVTDDGLGVADVTHTSGLKNLQDRAVHRGGTFTIGRAHEGGTIVSWATPL